MKTAVVLAEMKVGCILCVKIVAQNNLNECVSDKDTTRNVGTDDRNIRSAAASATS